MSAVKSRSEKKSNLSEDKVKMTVLLSKEQYLSWKQYELDRIQEGEKVSFQKIAVDAVDSIISKARQQS